MRLKEPIANLKPSELKMEGCCKNKDLKGSKKKTTAKKSVKMEQLKMKLN